MLPSTLISRESQKFWHCPSGGALRDRRLKGLWISSHCMASQRKSCQTQRRDRHSAVEKCFRKKKLPLTFTFQKELEAIINLMVSSFFLPENIWYNSQVYRTKF